MRALLSDEDWGRLPLATWRHFSTLRIPDGRIGGGFADELLLGGQRVLPNKALSRGFVFRHETLRSAFEAIL